MAQLNESILIQAPLDKVHGLATDPYQWATWYVGLSEPEEVTGDGGAGTVVKQNFLMAGLKYPVTNTVLEDEAGPEGARWKAKIEGPLAGEHTWTYTPEEGGTRVSVDMAYTVPGAALGKFADRLIVERMQSRSLEQTLDNLKLLCEAG